MDYGTAVYEHILESVVFEVNGVEYKRFDVATLIRELEIKGWGLIPERIMERKKAYKTWRGWLEARRARMSRGQEVFNDCPVTRIM